MRSVEIDGDKVGGIEISTDLSSIERRVGAACKIAKWMTGAFLYIIKYKFANNLQNNEHNIYKQRFIKCHFAKILQNEAELF